MDNALISQKGKFKTYIVWIFAFIGALASFLAILDFFKSENAQLQIDVYPNKVYVPYVIKSELSTGKGDNFRLFVDTILSEFCNKAEREEANGVEIDTYDVKDKHICSHVVSFRNASNLLNKVTPQTTFYEYKIKNTGKSVAKNIRLSGPDLIAFEVFSENGRIASDGKDEVTGSYILPSLNPNETLSLSLWVNGLPNYNYDEIYSWDDLPRVTFEKNSVSLNVWTHVPSQFYAIYNFFNILPLWLSLIFLIIICILITLILFLIISIPIGLAQGKSFQEIFATNNSNPKVDDQSSNDQS